VYVLSDSDNGFSYVYTASSQRARALKLQEDSLYTIRRRHAYSANP
jgi:hypothetical protein